MIYKDESQYVAECLDFPVISQGKTLDETVNNISEALELHLEDESMEEHGFVEKPVIHIHTDAEGYDFT